MNKFRHYWQKGYRRLVPITPPGCPVSERSSLAKRLNTGSDGRGKSPGVRWPDGNWSGFDWLAHETTEDDLDRWHDMGAGVGIKTGHGLALIDADTLYRASAIAIRDEVLALAPKVGIRVGRSPKAGYLVRTDADVPYQRIEFGVLNERGMLDSRVEILTAGRQFVADGLHPVTGKPYEWPRGVPDADVLPYVSGEALTAFLSRLGGILPSATVVKREGATTETDQASLLLDIDKLRQAVAATPNTSRDFPTRESWRDFGYAIKAAAGPGNEAEALDIYQEWSSRWEDGHNDPDVVASEFSRMKPPYRVGASYIYDRAEAASGGAFTAAERWHEPIRPVASIFPDEPENAGPPISPTQFRPVAPETVPCRQWLYGTHLVRKFISATVAPSGVGKSSLTIVEALAMASGKPLLGVSVQKPLKVWLWNGEDPRDEIERRIMAAMIHYGLTVDDIGDRLFVDSGRDMEIVLAQTGRHGTLIARPVADRVAEVLRENRIDVFQVDPFVSSHRVPENDNGAIDLVTKEWNRIADKSNCGIDLVHHVRKLHGAEVTVEDSRGAGAMIATARSVRTLAKMTKSEGIKFGLTDSYQRLFRFADGKNNLALPAMNDTQWMELRSIALGNGPGATPTEREIAGDSVGVVARYVVDERPREIAPDMLDLARQEIGAETWRRDWRSAEWIGHPIARAMRIDMAGDKRAEGRRQVEQIVQGWIDAGLLAVEARRDHRRQLREYVSWRGGMEPGGVSLLD